ncbi:MAG: hypothetical protein AAGD04_17315 [Pseudomonadota bacterium]
MGQFIKSAQAVILCVLVGCGTGVVDPNKPRPVQNDAPPSGNAYTIGNWNPSLYFTHMSDARQCASAKRTDCTRSFNFAKQNATSDDQYFNAARDHIAYFMARGDIYNAHRMATDLETAVPGSSFVREFKSANPIPREEGGFSVGKLIIVAGAVMIAGGLAVDALCNRMDEEICENTGGGTPSPKEATPASSSTPSRPGSNPSGAQSGYQIFDRYTYVPNSQTVIATGKCNGGYSFKVRYYPNNNPTHFIGITKGSSVHDVATKFCG